MVQTNSKAEQDLKSNNCESEAKWAVLIDDVLYPMPQQVIKESLLRAQAQIGSEHFIVRDHNSPNDVVIREDQSIDLAEGNVFYLDKNNNVSDCPRCESPAKLAFVVDDHPEITINPNQSGKTIRELFSLNPSDQLFHDIESPHDISVSEDDAVLFSRGPVFYTKARQKYRIIINAREKTVFQQTLTFADLVSLAYPDPPQGEFICFTITYRGGPADQSEGMLVEGDTVQIQEGMIFNVKYTDKS